MFDFLKTIYIKDGLFGVIIVMVLAIVFVAM